jgi:hypothetical protein
MASRDYDKTLTRLISILTKLSNKELPKTKDLEQEFCVTEQTIIYFTRLKVGRLNVH